MFGSQLASFWLPKAPESGLQSKIDDLSRDAAQLPTDSMSVLGLLFEFWEKETQLVRTLDAHHFNLPGSVAVTNPCNFESKLCHYLRLWESVPEGSLVKDCHFPDQPPSSEGSTEKVLTYWWGATLCPPEMKDLALAENLVYDMRMAAHREMAGKRRGRNQL